MISVLHFISPLNRLELHDLLEHLYYIPIVTGLGQYELLDPMAHLVLYNFMALLVGTLSGRLQSQLRHTRAISSELAEAYAELKATTESLRRADRLAALGQLSAGIAHEIRNPLGSIKGAVEILCSSGPTAEEKQEFASIIRQEVARINNLIVEFLRFARPPEPRIENRDVHGLLSATIRLLEGLASRHNVKIVRRCSCTTGRVSVDEDQIRQVLLNVLLNAVEAMADGGVLTLACSEDGDSNTVTIEVSDTGPGVDEDDLEHIFNPFFTTRSVFPAQAPLEIEAGPPRSDKRSTASAYDLVQGDKRNELEEADRHRTQ
ncbi:MAG: histidine kinase dimerization/phospho-acceptor domain-containing protein [Acidobacteriota bacterium]